MVLIRMVKRQKAKITNIKLYQISILLALVFFISCIVNIYSRIQGITYTLEVTEWDPSELGVAPPLGGSSSLVYRFDAPSTSLGKIYLFPEPNSMQTNLGNSLLLTLTEDATNKCLFSEHIILSDKTYQGWALIVEFPSLVLERNKAYRLELSMPEVSHGRGIHFLYTRSFLDLNDSLEVSGNILKGQSLALLLLPARPHMPLKTILVGILLFALSCVTAWREGKGGLIAFLALGGIVAVLSLYCWESRMWGWWGAHWPDGYVRIAHRFNLWFMGELTGTDVKTLLGSHRMGQVWIVPFLVALMSTLKLTYLESYMTLSLLFTLGGVGLLGIHANRMALTQQKHWGTPVFLGILMLHVCVIQAAFSPMTDAGGLFFTILFIISYSRVLEARNIISVHSVAVGVIIALGCQTRIALLPLAFLPLAMAIWRLCFSSDKRVAQAVTAALPSLIGIGLLIACWQLLNLWKTIGMAYAMATQEVFRQYFSLKNFAKASVAGLQFSIVIIPLSLTRLFRQDFLVACILLAGGFAAMLCLGKFIPYLRYWTPVVPLASMVVWVWLLERCQSYKLWLTLLGGQVLANLFYVILNPSFA